MFDCFGVRFVPPFSKKSQTFKSRENRTNIDIILSFLGKPVDKHGTTLVHITYPPLDFHAVHRVPRVVPSQKDKRDTPRQIIMRFTSRKDRDRVWAEKEKIKKCKEFSSCFFVADLPREAAQERAQLRRIAKRARDILKIKAEVRNDKLVLVESNLRYKLEEIPEYLKSGESKP